MPHEITVTVDATGEVKVGAKGVAGGGCKDLTRAIEAAIGHTVSDEKTSEFFQTTAAKQTATAQNKMGTP